MMDVLLHHYLNICLALGLFLFFSLLSYIMTNVLRGDQAIANDCERAGIGFIILSLMLNIILGFFTHLTRILTLVYLTPNHMLIAYDIVKVFIILNGENENKWYSIFFFIIQFFVLLFYLEILELNFCGLNENTKKNIEKRVAEEEMENPQNIIISRNSSLVEFDEGYVLYNEKKNYQEFEMGSLNDNTSNIRKL